jgi:hypothetical protein
MNRSSKMRHWMAHFSMNVTTKVLELTNSKVACCFFGSHLVARQ